MTIWTLLDAMKVADKEHSKAMDGFSMLRDHYDPETGEQKDSGVGSVERLLATVITQNFDPNDARGSLLTICNDLAYMAQEIEAVVDALWANSPFEEGGAGAHE